MDKELIYKSVAYFLKKEIDVENYSSDIKESIEVAKQCIEAAFHISTDSVDAKVPDLESLFSVSSYVLNSAKSELVEPTEGDKTLAEGLKNQGNTCMQLNQLEDALACYTKAIELSPKSAVYYCNRAAAYSRKGSQEEAIADCLASLRIDPSYAKAYGRMGVAYSNMGNHSKAAEAYRKGLELDPNSETCRKNLAIAEEQLRTTNAAPPGDGVGGFNLNSFMNNPAMQNMASQLMQDPNTLNIISRVFQNTFDASAEPQSAAATNAQRPESNGDQAGSGSTDGHVPGASMDDLLHCGHQLAEELRSNNPQLVEQLRSMFQSGGSTNPQQEENAHQN